jgi:hypothetical protein
VWIKDFKCLVRQALCHTAMALRHGREKNLCSTN